MRLLKILWRKTKELWNVYGGIALSTGIAYLNNFDKVEMDKWGSFLLLSLACISVLTFFKIVYFKKKKNVADRGVLSSTKSIKTLETAVNPLGVGEEIGQAIIYTVKGGKRFMQKIKNFFKELWGNKFTLGNTIILLFLATLSQVMTYTEYLYRINWFAEHELVVKIVSPIVAVIWVIIDLLTTYTKYGFESLEEIAERKLNKSMGKMTKEEKKKLKDNLRELKRNLIIVETKKSEIEKDVKDTETLIGSGYTLGFDERNQYDKNKTQLVNLDAGIEELKKRIKEVEDKL